MAQEIKKALTFDDVLIKPASSDMEPSEAELGTALCRGINIELPLISAAMDKVTEEKMAIKLGKLGGLGVIHRSCDIEKQVEIVKKVKKEKVLVGAACGPFDEARALALEKAGCDVIFIDCAHGHNQRVIRSAKQIKKKLKKAKLVVGNVATAEAAEDLVSFVDGIKVGVGPGSICTTRIVSGVGVPQLSAIMDVASVARKHKVPVIGDGGIRTSGDIAKALAAGASTVMIGNMFAGTDEAPGKIITKAGQKYKEYRGMGSKSVLLKGFSKDRYLQSKKTMVPEGVEALIPYKGSVEDIVYNLGAGVRIAMGYIGVKKVEDIYKKAEFIFVTKASVLESRPHDLSFIIDK